MKKRFLIVMLLLAFVFGQTLSVAAATINLTDIERHWAQSDIEFMVGEGVISGYPDGTFKPNGTITRAEFSKIQAGLMALTSNRIAFDDVKGHWAEDAISGLVEKGVIEVSEYPDGFEPNEPITRLEMSRMVVRGLAEESLLWKEVLTEFKALKGFNLPFSDQSEMSMADLPYIALANGSGIISGYEDGTFRMERSATRAEATVMLKRYLDAKNKKPVLSELLDKFKGEPNIHNFTKEELEAWIDKEAEIERLLNLPIDHYTGASLSERHDQLIYPMGHNSSTNRTNSVLRAIEDMTNFMNVYENLDHRTIGESWKNEIRQYYSRGFTYEGVHYPVEDLPKLFDRYVQIVKNGNYIKESFFVTDFSLAYQQKRDKLARNEFIIRGTQYVRYTSINNLPEGVELNKWYKRDVDVRYIENLWDYQVPWDTANNIWDGYTVITPYEEVTSK